MLKDTLEMEPMYISEDTIIRKPFSGDIIVEPGNELKLYAKAKGRLFASPNSKVTITQNYEGAIYADGNAVIHLKCEELKGAVLLYEATLIVEKKCFFNGIVYTDEGELINNSEQDIRIEEMAAEEQGLFEL